MTRHAPTVTDHPSALVSVPEMKTLSAGERAFTAWAATSRADGTPLMWTWSEMPHSQQERWEKIALAAAPAAPQAAGVGEITDRMVTEALKERFTPERYARDHEYLEANFREATRRQLNAALRARSSAPEAREDQS